MTTNQKESRKDILNVEKVHFTTDGNKKVCMFVDYKTNITEEYVIGNSFLVKHSSFVTIKVASHGTGTH